MLQLALVAAHGGEIRLKEFVRLVLGLGKALEEADKLERDVLEARVLVAERQAHNDVALVVHHVEWVDQLALVLGSRVGERVAARSWRWIGGERRAIHDGGVCDVHRSTWHLIRAVTGSRLDVVGHHSEHGIAQGGDELVDSEDSAAEVVYGCLGALARSVVVDLDALELGEREGHVAGAVERDQQLVPARLRSLPAREKVHELLTEGKTRLEELAQVGTTVDGHCSRVGVWVHGAEIPSYITVFRKITAYVRKLPFYAFEGAS